MLKTFPYNSIKPAGWMQKQLEIQANSLSGNLDLIWPDVRDSAWIGGDREGWERVPYWLDGMIPLAFLLGDEALIRRAEKYINAILDNQKEDGWICPCTEEERAAYDIWSLFLIGKVLAVYCDFTGSSSAEQGLYKAMKCLYEMLKAEKLQLFDWGKFRWYECVIPLMFLYERYPQAWIKETASILKAQGVDYETFTEEWKHPLNLWQYHTHIVNIAMMFKYEAVYGTLMGEKITGIADRLWKFLYKYNGTAVGSFAGDECLSGLDSNRGTELCSIVELMYSCEVLYTLTENPIWVERLEKLAFNALPATMSDDMWTHQYDQMVNQIACLNFRGEPFFRAKNANESNLFGLEPNYGCCTANFGQGWPKLVLHTFLQSKKGVVCTMMLPAQLQTEIKGVPVQLKMETAYPFRMSCRYRVAVEAPVSFELRIRIPKWAKGVCVDGCPVDAKKEYRLEREWTGETSFTIELADTPHFVSRPRRMKTVEYGPLVFSLPIEAEYKMYEYEKDGVERKFPYCDYELYPQSEWRYGFAGGEINIVEQQGDDIPFSSRNPRLKLKADFCRVDWEFADGYEQIAASLPKSRQALSGPMEMEMIPYGCAKLRMTEMPVVNKKRYT